LAGPSSESCSYPVVPAAIPAASVTTLREFWKISYDEIRRTGPVIQRLGPRGSRPAEAIVWGAFVPVRKAPVSPLDEVIAVGRTGGYENKTISIISETLAFFS